MATTLEIGIANYVQDYLCELHKEQFDQVTITNAKRWYKKFTGNDYPDASISELLEMYHDLQETC